MSPTPISHSPDLQQLAQEGYSIEVRAGHLLVHDIPYLNSERALLSGTLACPLDTAANATTRPSNHVMSFAGEEPCDADGKPLTAIQHSTRRRELAPGLHIDRSFSTKPVRPEGGHRQYRDYYEKVTTYASILSGPAQAIHPGSSPLTSRPPIEDESVHKYTDTASSRAGITTYADRLATERIGLIGMGGTNGYVLDFVAKTPVAEIHIFDGDDFLTHNAFRAPGAAPTEHLQARMHKTTYFATIYSNMHRGITDHPYDVDSTNLSGLASLTFVFIAIDDGPSRKVIADHLLEQNIPFIDVGIGLDLREDGIAGHVRTTLATSDFHKHLSTRMPIADRDEDAEYETNIQIAELNALNATLAVIRWKRLRGFYSNGEDERHSIYSVDANTLVNDEATE